MTGIGAAGAFHDAPVGSVLKIVSRLIKMWQVAKI